jgi:hypothetical protein
MGCLYSKVFSTHDYFTCKFGFDKGIKFSNVHPTFNASLLPIASFLRFFYPHDCFMQTNLCILHTHLCETFRKKFIVINILTCFKHQMTKTHTFINLKGSQSMMEHNDDAMVVKNYYYHVSQM